MAMARHLCASGAGQDLRGALWAYHHADWYVNETLDLAMLVVPGGQKRTADEYRTLLEKSGFRLMRVIPTRAPSGSIIEAIPA